MMLGFVGSGKSYVSRWLVPHVNAVYLRVDELRLAMFGADRSELYTPENKALVNGASRYAMMQIIKSGQANVVHDANHNSAKMRQNIAYLVEQEGAKAVVVWVKTPVEVAKERAVIRTVTEGHELFEENLVEKMAKRLEEPRPNEVVIVIDGQASAEEQKKQFDTQFAAIVAQS